MAQGGIDRMHRYTEAELSEIQAPRRSCLIATTCGACGATFYQHYIRAESSRPFTTCQKCKDAGKHTTAYKEHQRLYQRAHHEPVVSTPWPAMIDCDHCPHPRQESVSINRHWPAGVKE